MRTIAETLYMSTPISDVVGEADGMILAARGFTVLGEVLPHDLGKFHAWGVENVCPLMWASRVAREREGW